MSNIHQTITDLDNATGDAIARRLLADPAFVAAYADRINTGGEYASVARDIGVTAGRAEIVGRRKDSGQWEALASVPQDEEAALLPLWNLLGRR